VQEVPDLVAQHAAASVSGAPLRQVPARTAESDVLSRDLLRRRFKFVGSTICYAFMQAVGMVNDHTTGCHRYRALAAWDEHLAKRK
jgi:3-methyladenine DNA glycosylase Tag